MAQAQFGKAKLCIGFYTSIGYDEETQIFFIFSVTLFLRNVTSNDRKIPLAARQKQLSLLGIFSLVELLSHELISEIADALFQSWLGKL